MNANKASFTNLDMRNIQQSLKEGKTWKQIAQGSLNLAYGLTAEAIRNRCSRQGLTRNTMHKWHPGYARSQAAQGEGIPAGSSENPPSGASESAEDTSGIAPGPDVPAGAIIH